MLGIKLVKTRKAFNTMKAFDVVVVYKEAFQLLQSGQFSNAPEFLMNDDEYFNVVQLRNPRKVFELKRHIGIRRCWPGKSQGVAFKKLSQLC